MCNELNFRVNHKKNICFITIEFLNIELNNIIIKTKLFNKKLKKIKLTVATTLQKLFIIYFNLQLLIDFFLFAIKIVISNRVFLRRFFDAFRNNTRRYRIISVIKLNFI